MASLARRAHSYGIGSHFPLLVALFCLGSVLSSRFPSADLWKISTLVSLGLWSLGARFRVRAIVLLFLEATAFISLGGWNYQRGGNERTFSQGPLGSFSQGESLIQGLIVEAPEIRPDGVRFPLHVERVLWGEKRLKGKRILVSVKGGGYELKYGDRIRTRLKVRDLEPRRNPGGLNWQALLLGRGIEATGFLQDADRILLIERAKGKPLVQQMEDLRWKLASIINGELPSPARGLLLALVTGHSSAVERELRNAFSSLGLSHLLAISGLHFGLVVLWTHGMLRLIAGRMPSLYLLLPMDKILWLVSLPFLAAYAAMAGAAPSVKRALVMVAALSLALAMSRTRKLYHALALAAFVILIWDPQEIMELSFQLSFIAVMGLIYFLPPVTEWFRRKDPLMALEKRGLIWVWGRRMAMAAGATVAATAATFPIVVNNFHVAPLLAVPANLLMVPAAGWVVLPLALVGSFLFFIWERGGMEILWVAAWMGDWISRFCSWLADWAPKIYLPSLRPWEIGAFYLSLVGLARLRRSRWALPLLVCSLASFPLSWGIDWASQRLHPKLRVHFISVGNGASCLIETPDGKSVLIDGGGSHDPSFDVGSMHVAPVLWERRWRSIQRVILTHPHPDHMNGLPFILKAFRVTEGVWDNGDRPMNWDYLKFWEAAMKSGWEPQPLCGGAKWTLGDVEMEFIHPPCGGLRRQGVPKSRLTNENSLVVRISLGRVSFLIASDIGKDTEAQLASTGKITSTVLLVPHHGSRTSSSDVFLDAVGPLFAVFSAKAGPKGLAHPDVRDRYERRGIETFHTGEDGMVSFETDGQVLEITTYLSRKKRMLEIP